MNDNFTKLATILENEITNINNFISQNTLFLNHAEEVLSFFEGKNILNITSKQIEFLTQTLTSKDQLTAEELGFLQNIANISSEYKETLRTLNFEFNAEQQQIIEQVKTKLLAANETYSLSQIDAINQELNILKGLLAKLKDNNLNLIEEIEYIYNILSKYSIPIEEQIAIFEEINKFNLKIYSSFDIENYQATDQELSTDDLTITNLSKEALIELFKEFNLDFEQLKPKFQQLLSKYGVTQNIREILTILKDKNFDFIFQKQEILTKILLFSNAKLLEKLFSKTNEYQNLEDVLRLYPTFLYPTIIEKKVKIFNKKNPPTGDKKDSKSGQLNHLLGGITLLEELNIPVEEVLKNNVRFFSYSTSTIRRNLEDFQLYGLEGKKTLSWLAATRVLDKIDIAIESNCLAYYQENLSKLLNIDLNLYRIKYFCKKLNNIPNPMADSRIFSTRFFKSEGKELHFLSSSFSQDANYGITVEETFDKYCASQPDIPNLDYYKAIIAAENNNKITDLVLNDYVIQQLDEFYQDPTNPLVYNFDGVIISRLKVLRYYQTLISRENISSSKEPLLYAITVLSMLDQEELQTINNCINKIRFLKKA